MPEQMGLENRSIHYSGVLLCIFRHFATFLAQNEVKAKEGSAFSRPVRRLGKSCRSPDRPHFTIFLSLSCQIGIQGAHLSQNSPQRALIQRSPRHLAMNFQTFFIFHVWKRFQRAGFAANKAKFTSGRNSKRISLS